MFAWHSALFHIRYTYTLYPIPFLILSLALSLSFSGLSWASVRIWRRWRAPTKRHPAEGLARSCPPHPTPLLFSYSVAYLNRVSPLYASPSPSCIIWKWIWGDEKKRAAICASVCPYSILYIQRTESFCADASDDDGNSYLYTVCMWL